MAGRPAPELEGLFTQAYAGLVRALTVACGDREMAEDAVMDAFVQAHRHWDRISSYENPAVWVRRAAINRLSNRRRGLGRRLRFLSRASGQRPEVVPGPSGGGVATLLAGLPVQQRVAVALFYLEDLPVAEVAAAMGVSESTVKTHLRRAREHLAAALEVSGQ